MNIEIKNRFTGSIIISGEYENMKDCLQKNRGANLIGAYLIGANLIGANLIGAYLRGADLGGADLGGAYLIGADLGGANLIDANLRGADLGGADLRGANLIGAYLRGADLGGADLRGAKGYVDSHDIFIEAVRMQKVSLFVQAEWVAIAQIAIHRLCWDSIKNRFSKVMPSIFKKLAKAGFNEWLEYWNKL